MDENCNSRSSADSVDMSTIDASPVLLNGHMSSDEDNSYPKIKIVEQPQQRGFRFRYECEGPSHGGLQGASSEKYRKTNPAIRIVNYDGPAKVIVSLVTDEPVPRPHAHRLVGKNCQNGTCVVDVKRGTTQISFPNLCIQHVTRKKASEVLEQQIHMAILDDKRRQENNWSLDAKLTDEEKKKAKQEAANQAKAMQLNVVRLCFQCYLTDEQGTVIKALQSVVSDPIFDCKAPGANPLKICRMDKYSGCCTGNDEVFLLCEKVQKDDIEVRFVEQDADGNQVWEAFGHFGPFDVHRQFAIVFKTPEYRDVNIQNPVNVLVMLQRKSDKESSDPKSFTYYPRIRDKEDIDRKRRKLIPSYHGGGSFGGMNPSLGGGGGNGGTGGGGAANGGDGSKGLQNGGSIPDFNNLPLSQFGSRSMGHINHNGRQVLHAKRSPHIFRQPMAPALYSDAPADVIANSTEFLYEEVSHLSPPMAGLGGAHSPQYYNGNVSQTLVSPSDSAMMMGSPQNMGQTFSALSPQHSIQQHSPQNSLLMASQNQSMPITETFSGSQVSLAASDLQMNLSGLKIEQYSQPVQATGMQGVDIETDFCHTNSQLNTQIFDQYSQRVNQVFSSDYGMKPLESQLEMPHFGTQSCAWQARGNDTDLQDVIDVLEMVDGTPTRDDGYDEVDSAKVEKFEMSELVARSASSSSYDLKESAVPSAVTKSPALHQTAKLEPGISTPVTVTDDRPEEPVPYPTAVTENLVPLGHGREETAQSISTEDPSHAVVTTESSAQTDMDPLLKLSMKMSHALQCYAASGDIRKLLMVQRFLMQVQDQDGDLPLHTALINQRYEVFQNILDVMSTLPDSYARINAYNFHHQTPLHLAVLTDQPNAVDLLIRAGADSTLVDRNGYTPAHLAVLYGHDDCLKNLLKYLRPGVSRKEPFPELNFRCYDGYSPAHLACQLENLAAMKLLVWGKANINLPDGKSGQTPLHHAVEVDDLSLAAYLILQAGADVNIKRFDGNTALHLACGRGNVGMVALLMAGGADPDVENDDVTGSSDDSEYTESDESEESREFESGEDSGEDQENDNTDNSENLKIEDSEEKDTDTEKPQSDTRKEVRNRRERRAKHRRRGLVPADFAATNNKILRILNGEPYSSITGSGSDEVQQTTDRLASMRFTSHDSGHGSIGGDMSKVDYPVRMALSGLLDPLDPGCDWHTLADKLHVKYPSAENLKNNSPTRFLLTVYEAEGGTVAKLVQALVEMKRNDCISILQHLVDGSIETGDNKDAVKDPKFDSGLPESFHKPASPVH